MSQPGRCRSCRGIIPSASVPYYYEEGGQRWLLEHVPASVCDLCDRTTLDPSISARIQAIILDGGEPTGSVTVPVYDFSGAEPHISRSTRVA